MTAIRAAIVATLAAALSRGQIQPANPAPSEVRLGHLGTRTVAYQVVDGLAVTDGDIVFDRVASSKGWAAGAVSNPGTLWTGGVVPYLVDGNVATQQRITNAIAEWTAKTPLRFVPRTNQTNYIRFMRAPAAGTCNSWVGMIGGEQAVNIGDECSDLALIHEIGHAIGFWHEQSRNDRDQYLKVQFDNVNLACVYNYDKYQQTGKEISPYDYASAMQYYPYAYSRTGLPVMETIPAGIPIGSGTKLSAIDADAASRLYGRTATSTTVSVFPEGLQIVVDGTSYAGTQTFNWTDGTAHTISLPDAQGDTSQRYVFGRWSDGGAATHSVTAGAASRVFTAFLVRQYRTTVTALAGGKVTVSPTSADGFYTDRSFPTLTAVPDDGFSFKGWGNLDVDETGRLTFIYSNNYYGFGPQNPRTIEVNRARDITVLFTSFPVIAIQTDPPNMHYKIDGNEILAPQIMTGGEFGVNIAHAMSATLQQACRTQCITGTRYLFTGWSDQTAPDRVVNWDGNSNVTYTLRFSTQHQVSVFSQFPARGTVSTSPSPADGYFDEGSIITLTAAPASGSRFLNWQNGLTPVDLAADVTDSLVSSCGNPWLYRVNQPLSLFAYFGGPASPAPKPALATNGIVNAASNQGGAIAPGAILALYGTDLGPATLQSLSASTAGFFDTCVSATNVTFDGTLAPMIYSSQGQISAIVPYNVAGKSAVDVQVRNQGVSSNTVRVPVQAALPALFTSNSSGAGQAAAFNQDGSLNGASHAAAAGMIVVLFATGEGVTNPGGADGKLALDVYPAPVLPVKVKIAGADAEVLYAGAAPTLVAGVMQVNARVPAATPPGPASVVVTVGTFDSRSGVTIAVQ